VPRPPKCGPANETVPIAEYADYGRGCTRRTNQVQRSLEDTKPKQRGFELVLEA
jgi:hypothetical protein